MHANLERALGPVYEAIDNREFKKCSKLVEAVLRRYPRSHLVRSLKAYVAAQLGKSEIAAQILREVNAEGAEDDRVLHTMSFVYAAIGDSGGMLDAYMSAVEKRPNNAGIRVGLFGQHVRRLSYISQQQEALKLAKLDTANSDRYVWWSICSLMMQFISSNGCGWRGKRGDGCEAASAGDGSSSMGTKLVQLAYSMAERQEKLSGTLSYEKFFLMTELLCGLGRHDEAAERGVRFDTLCTDSIPSSEKAAFVGSLHVRAGAFEAASGVYLDSVRADPHDWVAWHMYLATMLPELVEDPAALPLGGRIDGGIVEAWDMLHLKEIWAGACAAGGLDGDLATRLEHVARVLDGLGEQLPKDQRTTRALALAGLEVAKYEFLCARLGHGGGQEGLCEAVLCAVPRLAVYSSFGADLRGYLAYLDATQKHRVAIEGREACLKAASELRNGADCSPVSESKAFVCVINGFMLQVEVGATLATASELIETYFDNVHLVKDYDPKDRGLGEELLVIAVSSLLEESLGAGRVVGRDCNRGDNTGRISIVSALLLGLVFIDAAQQARRVSAPLRLAASAIYGLLGAESLAAAEFEALDIKGVLHDSLTGHWMIPMIAAACPSEESYQKWFKGIDKLHTVQAQEARDALFTVYEEGTYSKVPEFVDFINCLDKSSTLYVYRSEAAMAACRKACLSGGTIEPVDMKDIPQVHGIIHNDDLTLRPAWYPPSLDGPLFEVHGWWEQLYAGDTLASTPGGLSDAWWLRQYAPTVPPSGQRANWEGKLNQQLALRLRFPGILAAVCSGRRADPPEKIAADSVSWWTRSALEAAGIASPTLTNDPSQLALQLAEAMLPGTDTSDIASVSLLRALTVLVGYQVVFGSDNKGQVPDELERLAKGVTGVGTRCAEALRRKPFAGVPFLARIASEEFLWVSHMIYVYANADGDGIAPKASLAAVAMAVSDSADSLSAALGCLDPLAESIETFKSSYHPLSDCMRRIQGYDVDKCLSNVTGAMALTRARIQDALSALDALTTKTMALCV